MSDTLTTLAAKSPQAERVLYSPPDWVVIGTETGASTTATVTAVTNKQHFVQKAVVSFSAAPAGALTFTIKDGVGGTTIFQAEIPAATTAPAVYTFEKPFNGSTGNAIVGNVGSPAGSVVATIWMCGITCMKP